MAVKMSVAEVTSTIKSCIISRKGGIPINEINEEYEELVGERIPFHKFGFGDLSTFLKTLPDVHISSSVNGVPVLTAGGEKTAHITQLINHQRSAPNNRRKKKSSRVPSGKIWEQRRKRSSFDKSPKARYSKENGSEHEEQNPNSSENWSVHEEQYQNYSATGPAKQSANFRKPLYQQERFNNGASYRSAYDNEIEHGVKMHNKFSVYSKQQSNDHYEHYKQIYDDDNDDSCVSQNVNGYRGTNKHKQRTNRKEMGQPYNEDFYHHKDQYAMKQGGSVPKLQSDLLNGGRADWETEQQHWFESLGQDVSAKQYLNCVPKDRYEQYYRRYWNRYSNGSGDYHYDAGSSSSRSHSTNSPKVTNREVKMVGNTLSMTVKNSTDSDRGEGDAGRKKSSIPFDTSEIPLRDVEDYQLNDDLYEPVFVHHQLIGDDFFLHLASKRLKRDCEYREGMLHRCGLCISGQTIRDCRLQVLQSQGIASSVLLLVGAVDILSNMSLVEMKLDMLDLLDVLDLQVESVTVLTIPPLINVETKRHLYRQIITFNKWLWSMHKDGRLQVIDIWSPLSTEDDGIDYDQYERYPRILPNLDSKIILWNRWGRESVLKHIALELGFKIKT